MTSTQQARVPAPVPWPDSEVARARPRPRRLPARTPSGPSRGGGAIQLDAPYGELDDWRLGAACRAPGVDTGVFFAPPSEGHLARAARESTAKAVCAACPVRLRCADYAVAHRESYGVWGGLTERERRDLRQRARRR